MSKMKKQAEQNQRESGFRSESFYSSCKTAFGLATPCCTILESISDVVFTVDFEKRITFFNRAAELITGFRAEEAIGQYCFDIFRANTCHDKCPMDAATAEHPQINVRARIIDKSLNLVKDLSVEKRGPFRPFDYTEEELQKTVEAIINICEGFSTGGIPGDEASSKS